MNYEAVLSIVALLSTAAVAYFIGFKHGGKVFEKNLRLVLSTEPEVAFSESAFADLVEYEKEYA